MKLEKKDCKDQSEVAPGLMLTPPVGEDDYWLFRVELSDKQALIAFPKFGTIGIGFENEEDWNTNLPYTSEAEEIFDHISHNKADDSITDKICLEAINMLQEACRSHQHDDIDAEEEMESEYFRPPAD
jgi:hypothetical protein